MLPEKVLQNNYPSEYKNPCHNHQYFSQTVGDNRGRTESFTSEYCQIFCLELHGDINANWEYLCETFESYDTLIAQTKVPMVRGKSCKLFIDKEI